MDGPQIRLKLMLDLLGLSSDVATLSNRICIQKAVFLAKYAEMDLGYSYNWYVHGPYSPELTSDYFDMDNDISHGDSDYKNYELVPSLIPMVNKVKQIMEIPSGVSLNKTEWLELLSSIIYWMNSTKDASQTKKIVAKQKSELCKNTNYDIALKKLKENNFLLS
ncbi:MAG: hypothetical protein ABR999_06295 [Methanoregula sp.]|jgi:uncharacterized protein YwgA|uniref:hypothetical protein n=1 Tax=Methanoregula sp. TaxID=2052170 RepID=UPI003D151FFB